jgi:putative glutamine amidotransferase
MPVLGICRGLQALNVARGGTLHQHLADVTDGRVEHRQTVAGTITTHHVEVATDSLLAEIVGGYGLKVNSFHHQAVETLGTGLRAVAWSPDGVVEAIESVTRGPLYVGVQWHAESLVDDPAELALFALLVDAANAGSAPTASQAAA